MNRSAKFWIQMALFQVIFGLAIFTFTRQYYIQDSSPVSNTRAAALQPGAAVPDPATDATTVQFNPLLPGEMNREDPAVIARQADEFFARNEYQQAADLYQQLLAASPNDPDAHNNLGITLHYLGRSAEALEILNKGVEVDANYQRIWLTLGFVNKQLGNTMQARTALTTAVQLGADNDIGRSAGKMLEDLPQG
jgi:tetratricopeptide (TPR) repeat protein